MPLRARQGPLAFGHCSLHPHGCTGRPSYLQREVVRSCETRLPPCDDIACVQVAVAKAHAVGVGSALFCEWLGGGQLGTVGRMLCASIPGSSTYSVAGVPRLPCYV